MRHLILGVALRAHSLTRIHACMRASRPSLSSCRRTVSSVPPGRRHGAALSAYGSLLRHGSKPTIQPSFPSETLAGGAHNHWKPTYRSYVTQLAAHLPPGPPHVVHLADWTLLRRPHLELGPLTFTESPGSRRPMAFEWVALVASLVQAWPQSSRGLGAQ